MKYGANPKIVRNCDPIDRALSPRELEVLDLYAKGMDSKEIGGELGISHRTVEIHIGRAKAILGARSITHAVAIGFAMGIIKLPDLG